MSNGTRCASVNVSIQQFRMQTAFISRQSVCIGPFLYKKQWMRLCYTNSVTDTASKFDCVLHNSHNSRTKTTEWKIRSKWYPAPCRLRLFWFLVHLYKQKWFQFLEPTALFELREKERVREEISSRHHILWVRNRLSIEYQLSLHNPSDRITSCGSPLSGDNSVLIFQAMNKLTKIRYCSWYENDTKWNS